MIKKVLLALLCIVMAGALMMALRWSRQEEQARSAELREVKQQMSELYSRQRELQDELDSLEEDVDTQMAGMATLSLLLTSLNSSFFGEAAPALREAEIPAVMVLSQEQYPGARDCIELEEFQQYIEDGWDYCVSWDGSMEFDEWYDDMSGRLEELELTMPRAIYCTNGSYSSELEQSARTRGFNTIVHSGEAGLSLVETEVGVLWRPGSISWLSSGVKSRLDQTIGIYGSIVFVIGEEPDGSFQNDQFSSMLRTIGTCQEDETLLAATLADARSYRAEVDSERENYRDQTYLVRRQELEQEIEALKQQIQELAG